MRRSRLDIVIDILEVAKEGVNKTGIVYRTNLNFQLTDKYLALLIEKGFLEKREEKYATTDAGKAFLEKAREITSQISGNFLNIPRLSDIEP
ncbi:MAG: winged helix-turn-helix domain-containing protein [Euryarchaeota archaeon]|nr:winged helix-turn-helix domain-containing protein [Euryarchaeota archaeon]MCG2736606.1 winged helix-turn-helix domain-containing protein [Candidatus Methanoperedenaceae archaeon]